MKSTSISDVRRMCQRGAFRAYVQGGKVFLEDTATGQVVPLNGENSPANTERRAAPHREDRRGSRVERMFGARDTWKSADPDADQGPYRGFLIVQCEECGAIKAFCAKHETYGYKCGECGHETPLEKLRPLFMHCKCGKSFSYKTNLTADRVTQGAGRQHRGHRPHSRTAWRRILTRPFLRKTNTQTATPLTGKMC